MLIGALDHINLRSNAKGAEEIVRFYCDILGLRVGPRPAFADSGYWLYAGVRPLIHVTVRGKRQKRNEPHIDHVAFSAQDLRGAVKKLRKNNIPYITDVVPGTGTQQIFFLDPDGNQVELDFHADEKGDMSDFSGTSEKQAAE